MKYIAEHQPAPVLLIKSDLGMSIGSIYHHLKKLGTFVSQDQNKRYVVSEEGGDFLAKTSSNSYAWVEYATARQV